jgi:tetratricopeptide (TPR) repeat protein
MRVAHRTRSATLLLLLTLACLFGARALADRPLILVAQTRAAPIQTDNGSDDPNIDLLPHLITHLKELRKLEVVAYSPKHPSVQRFALEKKMAPEALESPDTALLLQIGRALNAQYVLIVRCTRSKESEQLEYVAEVWQPGRRSPLWQTSGKGQVRAQGGSQDASLQSLARTLTLRLDTELWNQLARLPELPDTGEEARAQANPQRPPAQQADLNQLLREGRLYEALPLLRAAVNQNPLDADLRLQLIELYARLGMKATALDECERAMHLMPQNERLIQRWARLMRDEGRLADAMRTLKAALQTHPTPTLQLLLFDFQLWAGDFEGAEATLNAMRAHDTPEVRWRAYLMQGIKRQFNGEHEAQPLTSERLPALLFVVNGIMNDLANELLDLKRLASDPTPDWKSLRERGEQMVVRALDFGAWLGRLQPDEATRDAHTHLQFGAYLMGQAAQQMARYLRFRKAEDLDQATLLRAEALRELTAATPPPEP